MSTPGILANSIRRLEDLKMKLTSPDDRVLEMLLVV
jgi:hypothetical protein